MSGVRAASQFDISLSLPHSARLRQLDSTGSLARVNIGALIIMPEGFRAAPKERITPCEKIASKGTYLQPFNRELDNIIVLGPIESSIGTSVRSILFPSISPASSLGGTTGRSTLGSFSFFGAANLGRGQLFPTGDASSNSGGSSNSAGVIRSISLGSTADSFSDETPSESDLATSPAAKRSYPSRKRVAQGSGTMGLEILGDAPEGQERNVSTYSAPCRLYFLSGIASTVSKGEQITDSPSVSGYGQGEFELTLLTGTRINSILSVLGMFSLCQFGLVAKKIQVELIRA